MKTTHTARATIALDTSELDRPTATQEFRWNTVPVGKAPAREGQYGELLGYVAHAYGPYAAGGNPVLQGPRRATAEEAQADAANPARVLWRVVGYLCG